MSNYVRAKWPGGLFYITIVTYDRTPLFKIAHCRMMLRKSWIATIKKHPFYLEAICLLPEHIHLIMRLPEKETNYSIRIA